MFFRFKTSKTLDKVPSRLPILTKSVYHQDDTLVMSKCEFLLFQSQKKIQRNVTGQLADLGTCAVLGYFNTSTFGAHSSSFDDRVRFVWIERFPDLGVHPCTVHEYSLCELQCVYLPAFNMNCVIWATTNNFDKRSVQAYLYIYLFD